MTALEKIKAIEQKNKQRILSICPQLDEKSGIYIIYREENGFKYAYVGQAKHILTRLANHLSGYQHIDLSIKKHGFYNAENLIGYKLKFMHCTDSQLDEYEQKYILAMANCGYQLRNKTAGGQGEGKFGIADNKTSKGYYEGIKQGYQKAQKEVAVMFKHLTVKCNSDNKQAIKALEKFNEYIRRF